jgi:nucleotide-binding universal stress UspA family protein
MIPFTRILCPVDFSDGSRYALDHAAMLAQAFDARIAVLYVHLMSVPIPAFGYAGMLAPVPLTEAGRAGILQTLDSLVAGHRQAGLAIDTLLEEELSVPSAIVRVAAAQPSDLIVLGAHGRSGFSRLVLGSVANKVLKTAARPVVVVPPPAQEGAAPALRRIACAIDFSTASLYALDIAAALAEKSGARLTAVHVVETGGGVLEVAGADASPYRTTRVELAQASLAAAISPGVRAVCDVDELLAVGKPYREILRVVAEQQADLLVLGTHGVGTNDPTVFGATAQHVIRQAPCPVLAVPAAGLS